eukprot:TRINITY_DN24893_c0_g1_i1.p1 TRINITY_DN24893_c0_g1~~TRINITY_DN24893_c0_g1_i1.p1  ORF type:complete len:636 (-),score=90.99 TRINITY_DN24893_c0_g1_i1:210-2006(-)
MGGEIPHERSWLQMDLRELPRLAQPSSVQKPTSPASTIPAAKFSSSASQITGSLKEAMTPRASMISACSVEPDVLRGVQARKCLWGFGQILRSNVGTADTWRLSKPVGRISRFWSHSWRASSVFKIVTLLYHYNGKIAFFSSAAVAMLAAVLVNLGHLPGQVCLKDACSSHDDCGVGSYCSFSNFTGHRCFDETTCCDGPSSSPSIDGICPSGCDNPIMPQMHVWPLIFGIACFTLMLLFWQPVEYVFLDKVCIHQTDSEKKQKGIDGLGGFLHNSNVMSIFWDTTYFTRLWCVFEMAAFLHLNGEKAEETIEVVPIIRGFVIVVSIFSTFLHYFIQENAHIIGWGVAGIAHYIFTVLFGFWFFHFSRKFARDYLKMQSQIQSFDPEEADCFCCTVGHKMPDTGEAIPCDREVINESIEYWYTGGLVEFKENVRKTLHSTVHSKVGQMYSYFDAVIMGLANFCGHMCSARWFCMNGPSVQSYLTIFLYDWLGLVPFQVALAMLLSVLTHRKCQTRLREMGLSFFLAIAWMGSALGIDRSINLVAHSTGTVWGYMCAGVVLIIVSAIMLSERFFSLLLRCRCVRDVPKEIRRSTTSLVF